MLPTLSLKRRRAQEAARWYARLNATIVARNDLEAFRAWRAKPGADRAFAEVEAAWRAMGPLRASPEVQAILDAPSPPSDAAIKPWRTPGWAIGCATALALVVVGIGGWTLRGQRLTTGIGERRTALLRDGSRLTLDAQTELRILPWSGARHLVLDHGRILADVAPDAAHLFVVDAGTTRVTALGTAFTVRRRAAKADVVLIHGRVDVRRGASHLELSAGQAVQGRARLPTVVDASDAVAWTHGRIILDHATPLEAVGEINLYAAHPLHLSPDLAGAAPVSGVFAAGDTDAFLKALQRLRGWRAEPQSDGSILVVAEPPTSPS